MDGISTCEKIHSLIKMLPRKTVVDDDIPAKGVYFFYEDGELNHLGEPRIVRVGTTRKAPLRERLKQHYGGNRASSVFRKHVGSALLAKYGGTQDEVDEWCRGRRVRAHRFDSQRFVEIEDEISHLLPLKFSFRVMRIDNPIARLIIEMDLIAGLTSCPRCSASKDWLGKRARDPAIRCSGVWNVEHVKEEPYLTEVILFELERTQKHMQTSCRSAPASCKTIFSMSIL